MGMSTKERLQRLLHPTCVEDYGIGVDLSDVARDCPEIFAKEIAPFLPADAVRTITDASRPRPDKG